VKTFQDLGNSRETIGFSNSRMAYDDVLAKLLFFLDAKDFGSKSTESRISERFRIPQAFPPEVFERARRAIELFSSERADVERCRLNKASTLSWLMFYARFDESPEPAGFFRM